MEPSSKAEVESILTSRVFAVAGVSRYEHKYGTIVYRDLKRKGRTVYAINPSLSSIDTDRVYPSPQALPGGVEVLITVIQPDLTLGVVQEAFDRGIRKVWMQEGSESKEAVDWARAHGMAVVWGQCILMR